MLEIYKNQKGKDEVLNSYNDLLKQWGVEFIEEDIQTTFGSTHCILAGKRESPPLLLLHGVGDNSAVMWVLNIKELSSHFFCIAVDTMGGPGKSIPNDQFTKDHFTQQQWLNEIVNHYKWNQFNMAGVSNGGVMAFNYAVKESSRVRKVVCLESGMVTNPMKAIISTIGMMFPEILLPTKNNMAKIMKKMISPNSDAFDKNPQFLEHLLLLMKLHNRKAMFVHNIDKYDREAAIKIRDKFYFILGDYHVERKKEFIDLLLEGGYKYKVIENAGHGVNHEQSEKVNKEIIDFLSTT